MEAGLWDSSAGLASRGWIAFTGATETDGCSACGMCSRLSDMLPSPGTVPFFWSLENLSRRSYHRDASGQMLLLSERMERHRCTIFGPMLVIEASGQTRDQVSLVPPSWGYSRADVLLGYLHR